MTSLINKGRKPKFDLHLTIYDLNNVPLVSGVSLIKWHLPHSIHSEHRGRTQKCPIANHRVEYNYSKLVPVRIAIDRNNNLAECFIDFEVLQEFSTAGSAGGASARDEKITLGTLRINLSEYIEESEALLRDGVNPPLYKTSITFPPPGDKSNHQRKRSSMSGMTAASIGGTDVSPRSSHKFDPEDGIQASDVQEGVVRRYLMEESKINSTLKIGILMVQVDGERNYVAPPLKTAAVFGGIAGIVSSDHGHEPTDPSADASGQAPSLSNKSRDLFEIQDAYRRVLTASWASQPGELPADQCIEDIFSGGDGFRTAEPHHPKSRKRASSRASAPNSGGAEPSSSSTHESIPGGMPNRTPSTGSSRTNSNLPLREDSGSTSDNEDLKPAATDAMSTLRPRDISRLQQHFRHHSGMSDRSTTTVMMGGAGPDRDSSRTIGLDRHGHHRELLAPLTVSSSHHRRNGSKDRLDPGHAGGGHGGGDLRSRSESLTSLATTLGSDRGRDGFKRAREVDEFEVREDLVSWVVPGIQS